MLKLGILLVLFVNLISCESITEAEKLNSAGDNQDQKIEKPADLTGLNQCERSLAQRINRSDVVARDGKVNEFIADLIDGTHEQSHKFVTKDGAIIDLNEFDAMRLPKNITIQLALTKTKEGYEVYRQDNSLQAQIDCIGSREVETRITRETNKNIGFFLMVDTSRTAARDEQDAYNRTRVIQDYFNQVADGKWEVTVKGYNVNIDCSQFDSDSDCASEFSARTRRLQLDNGHTYRAVNYYLRHPRYCGLAQIGGSYSQNWTNQQGCTSGTWLHELGHNFGLHHSSTPGSEYGDVSSMMGRSRNRAPLNAPQMHYLDLDEAEYTELITQTKKVFLAPLEWDSTQLYDGLTQIAYIRLGRNGTFYFSTRTDSGDLAFEPTRSFNDRISVHEFTSDRHTVRHDIVLENGTYNHQNLFKVTNVEVHPNGIVEADIYVNVNDNVPGPMNLPQRETPQCQGASPLNATICEMDESGLAANLSKVLVNSCTDDRKCEFTCNTGYQISSDGQSCESIPTFYSCTGAVPANSTLCSGDSSNLEMDVMRMAVNDCTATRKCEYTCNQGFMLDGDRCVAIPQVPEVEIRASKIRPNGTPSTTYSMASDTIYWRIKEAGPNAKACVQFELDNGRSNWGHCENLGPNSSKWYIMKNQRTDPNISKPWFWSEQYQVWALAEELSTTPYYLPGRFKMFWFNPDTGKRKSFEYRLGQ